MIKERFNKSGKFDKNFINKLKLFKSLRNVNNECQIKVFNIFVINL